MKAMGSHILQQAMRCQSVLLPRLNAQSFQAVPSTNICVAGNGGVFSPLLLSEFRRALETEPYLLILTAFFNGLKL